MTDAPENKYVVAALIRLRRDTAFRIVEMEKQTEAVRADLVHIDAVLRMFAPELDLDTLPMRLYRPKRLDYFSHGEITRRVFDCLREKGGEIAAIDVVRQAMVDKGLSFEGDRKTRIEFGRRITMQLNGIARKGKVAKIGFGRSVRWRLPT
jgi:hypothetical protein